MDRSKMLAEESTGKLLWSFSLPAIIGMMVSALYNVVDSIFVGNGVGPIGLTAVTIAFPLMIVMMGFGMLVGLGSTALVSIRLGEKKMDEAENILGNAVSAMVLIAAVLTAVFLIFLEPILLMLGAEPDVLPYAKQFATIIVAGSIFQYIGLSINNIIRAEGNPKIAMASMLISAILNTILNPTFIFLLHMGIRGSALATVISQAVTSIWVLSYFLGEKSLLKLRRKYLRIKKDIIMKIISIGMAPFLMQIAASVVTVLFNYKLIKYGGDMAVAAMGVINRVSMLTLMPIFGINQGAQPIIGFNYGAKNYDRVKDVLKKAVIAASLVCIVGFILIQVFSRDIIRIFNNNAELIDIGSNGLKIMMFMLPIIGFQIVSSNYFQAIGKATHSIFLSLSRQVILLIPLIAILPGFFGLHGIWLAGPSADFGSSIITGIFLFIELGKLRDLHEQNA